MAETPQVHALLGTLCESIRTEFSRQRRVLAFSEYLELLVAEPARQLRSAAQYLVDCFEHFGTTTVRYPYGELRRFSLFDCPWSDGADRLFGQEQVQNAVYEALRALAREGRANKVILLHGPNGSAKSTFLRCLGRAAEHYSTLDQGALFRFSWIFPSQKNTKSGIGFGGGPGVELGASYAGLPDEAIDARLGDELRDHPILLIPVEERAAILERLALPSSYPLSDYVRYGTLSAKNRAVYDALLASYQGDYEKVLRHVRVERFYVSQRYRTGWVTVEPQLTVDASERQVTADRSLAALPPSLQSVALHEYSGEIVGANRGLIEYDDLLKRPLEHYKYLLTTVERGTLSMPSAQLPLDLVFLASSNDIHLSAFRELPDFQSFKGRFELVRVPYILDVRHEEQLYEARLREAAGSRHVAPHTAFVAALWAVLSRMRKPQVERYPSALAEVLSKLSPMDKVLLYTEGQPPPELSPDKAKLLLAHVKDLWHESDGYPIYEGRVGASPREMQALLLTAAGSARHGYISPLVVLDEITELTKQSTLYDFLRQDAQPGGYHDHRKLIEVVRQRLFDRIDDQVRSAVGLVEESEYARLFERYITHVMHSVRKEKVRNPATGRMEEPDAAMMTEVEKTLELGGRPEELRGGLIAKIGAWSLDHKGQKPVLTEIFPELVRKLRDATFERHKKAIARGVRDVMVVLADEGGSLDAESRTRAEGAIATLLDRHGYARESLRDLVGALAGLRYRG